MIFFYDAIIEESHPSLPGHFPGNPIVPGVVLLEQVRMAVSEWCPGFFISALPQVKFPSPLLPGQVFKIKLEKKDGKYSFWCARGEVVLAQGGMRLEAKK